MVNQYVWIGIAVGIFFVGIGIGYSMQPNTVHMMTTQQMQQMMNDPQAMNQWMNNPQHVKQMTELMRQNHDFTQQMIMEMINDPNTRLQMLGHMTENPEMLQQMRNMMGDNMTGMMNHP